MFVTHRGGAAALASALSLAACASYSQQYIEAECIDGSDDPAKQCSSGTVCLDDNRCHRVCNAGQSVQCDANQACLGSACMDFQLACTTHDECVTAADAQWYCSAVDGTCRRFPSGVPTCTDGILGGGDSNETDMDCGGACAACAVGRRCREAADCTSRSCIEGICMPACDDDALNGDETDVDCGGSCTPCVEGDRCDVGADCDSGSCGGEVCLAPACDDGVWNGDETDQDCGGSCGATCGEGADCIADADCFEHVCNGTCLAPTCTDRVTNGDESDRDCGGSCFPCIIGQTCALPSDCASRKCVNLTCEASSCTDGIIDGDETDVDCGGLICPACVVAGQACTYARDCASANCVAGSCTGRPLIATGLLNSCALLSGGSVRCWGANLFGTLGYARTDPIGDDETPASVGDVDVGDIVESIDVSSHTCAVLTTGGIRCWGLNGSGQLGYDTGGYTVGDDEVPSSVDPIPLGEPVVQVAVGTNHTCALVRGGHVRCWGDNRHGQLGYPGTPRLTAPAGDVDAGGRVVQLVAGEEFTCALLEGGTVRCWGWNAYGQLGYGHTDDVGRSERPAQVGDVDVGNPVIQLSAKYHHVCALLASGSVRCWGEGAGGRLGYSSTENIGDDEVPADAGDINVGGVVTAISAGGTHTCVLLDRRAVRCWGGNNSGQLGYGHTDSIGDDEDPATAGDVNVGGPVASLSAAGISCAVLQAGGVRCWGSSMWGVLGYGNEENIGDDELPFTAGDLPIE